jgi:RNase P protein component
LRETFRRNRSRHGVDIVLLAKPDIGGRTREEVEREFRQRLRRLASRKPGRGAIPPAAD